VSAVADEEIARRLASTGLRWTPGRREVVAAFGEATAPLSVQDVQQALAMRVPLSSLYRILADLVAARVLIRLEFAEGFARYELDEELAVHHHHLVCTECGAVADLELPELERTLGATAGAVTAETGFAIRAHRVDFFGVCASCRQERAG
jgi:Fur family ferric uptake transcriptional regulator